MRPHPAARSPDPTPQGLFGGLRRRARAAAYGTGADRLLPWVVLEPDTRQPRMVLGTGEVRSDVTDRLVPIGWDPGRVVVGLESDGPLAAVLVEGATGALTLSPSNDPGPRWRGHAAPPLALGHLLFEVEARWSFQGSAVVVLGMRDAETTLLREREAWARRTRQRAADTVESLLWTTARPLGLATTAVGEDEAIFPVDLVGTIGHRVWALSLRRDTESAKQVLAAGHLTWSSVDASAGRSVHDLRVGHRLHRPGELSADVRHQRRSPTLDLPLPMWALRTVELRVQADHHVGDDHHVFLCEEVGVKRLRDAPTLGHLHRDALAWRQRAGWPLRLV
jgi:hypothetical protein